MKIKNLILLLTLTILGLAPSAKAQFNYTTNNGVITITEYTGSGGAVAIPSSVNGYPVTSIGVLAFYGLTNLTSITIPNSVTSIGTQAFYYCTSLTDVILGNGLTSIGDGAFSDCTSLTSIIIPNSVTSIGGAFSSCTSLTNVILGNGLTSIVSAFFNCTNLTSIIIPNSVTSIGDAFSSCTSLTNVILGNGLTSIGGSAFYYCTSLTSIIIPTSVTSIGYAAFNGCTSLTSITFRGNAPILENSAFSNIAAGATVYYYYGTTGWDVTYGGLPTVMLEAPAPQVGSGMAMQAGGFGFTLTGVANQTIVVEATTNLVDWQPIWTNRLSGTSIDFIDPLWTNYSNRFYRVR